MISHHSPNHPRVGVEKIRDWNLGQFPSLDLPKLTKSKHFLHFTSFSTSSNIFVAKMVLAFVGQVTYLGLMAFVCLTTLIAMFTPEWRIFVRRNELGAKEENEKNEINSGMFFCENLGVGTCLSKHSAVDSIVTVCLVLALLFEFAALGWAIASLMACCVQKLSKFLFYPLPALSGGVSLFLFLAILLFALKQEGQIEFDLDAKVDHGANIGYSFYICCVSFVFSLATVATGVWTAFFLGKDR